MSDRTVLLADDHPLFRHGLRGAIEAIPGHRVIAEAGDGETALQHIRIHQPDIAVIDLAMPGLDGFQVVEGAGADGSQTRIVIMTAFKEPDYLHRAIELGAAGFLVKDDALDDLARCLRAVADGDFYLSSSIGLPAPAPPSLGGPETADPRLEQLTAQQREILRHVADCKTSKEIARQLDLSPRTVENHRYNISTALDLRGPNRLLRFAIRNRRFL